VNDKFKLVKIKNRIKALQDIMVNFWFEDRLIAEFQMVLNKEEEAGTVEEKALAYAKDEYNHFLYEIHRDPMGIVYHCAEILMKLHH